MDKKIRSTIEDYIEAYKHLNFEDYKYLILNDKRTKKITQSNLSKVENIETGISGYLLFFLEVFRLNRDDLLLLKIRSLSDELINYCKKNETQNFSFYTGRAGVSYFLLQLYIATKEIKYLNESLNLIQPCQDEYFNNSYTSDYFYDGRAGTLFVLLELYKISPSDKIFNLIEIFTVKLSKNGVLSKDGLSWNSKLEVNLKDSCGFAHGASGVYYALNEVSRCFPDSGLDYILERICNYVSNSFNDNKNNWRNYEVDFLTKEKFTKYLKAYRNGSTKIFDADYNIGWASGKCGISQVFGSHSIDKSHYLINENEDLYSGLSGIGLCLLQDYNVNCKEIKSIAKNFINDFDSNQESGGLLYGNLGKMYFLVKILSEKKCYSILKPFISCPKRSHHKLSKEIGSLPIHYLKRNYLRTINLYEKIAPNTLKRFLKKHDLYGGNEFYKFQEFIKVDLEEKKGAPAANVLNDIFHYETEIAKIKENEVRTPLQKYLDIILKREKLIDPLNKKEEWLIKQKLIWKDNLVLKSTGWNWSSGSNNLIKNFYEEPNDYKYVFVDDIQHGLVEYSLDVDGIVLDHFQNGRSVEETLESIKYLCENQTDQTINKMVQATGSDDKKDFINRLDFLVLHKVRQFLYDDILKFTV
ncbi:lanthionine synthetase LanC family protein [Salegentibacter sp. UBA1130]|uniref:lanthionine synthetase LanC family protein n=1 Tax=Salegentibacter sp. UBA1130 TaxID=1947451 RepID=UPI002580ED11|nr:lanthionine synthetase LanC family protein [Salegentibacter sp. UBA1130]